jgi:hypothetical protein
VALISVADDGFLSFAIFILLFSTHSIIHLFFSLVEVSNWIDLLNETEQIVLWLSVVPMIFLPKKKFTLLRKSLQLPSSFTVLW